MEIRNPSDVITSILGEIPEGSHQRLRTILISMRGSASDRAAWPHIMGALPHTLGMSLQRPDELWKERIAAIVANKPLPGPKTTEANES